MSDLDRQMAVILLRLELVSHGSCQAWNSSGGFSGEPDDRVVALVAGRPTFPHLEYREAYERARSEAERVKVFKAAEAELESWTHNTTPRPVGKSLVEIILEDGVGFDPRIVAERYGVDQGFVRRKRMAAGLDHESGRELESGVPADRTEAVAELSRRGLSQVQIAKAMGISQPTVHRLLKTSRFRRSAA